MMTLVLATRNPHKVAEIQAILGREVQYLALTDFAGAPEVVEDAATFAGNATKKAAQLARWLGQSRSTLHAPRSSLVLADDSGLEVDALNGAPGVHSARFAALDTGQPGNSSAAANNAKLLRLLENVPLEKRTARFRCVVALAPITARQHETASPVCYADEIELQTELFEGVCEGRLGFDLKGRGGFGYDPLFCPAGCNQTFGELSEDVKNQLSHRAKALAKLKPRLAQLVVESS
jgi:XTP/dITP diphosphohydrolase